MELDAGGRRRFCAACDKHVHDLSAMDERSAAAFWEATAQLDVCISYLSDTSGEIVFAGGSGAPRSNFVSLERLRKRADRPQSSRARAPAQAAAAASLTALLAACTPHGDELEVRELDAQAVEAEAPQAPVVIPPAPAGPAPDTAQDTPCETSEPETQPDAHPHVRKKGKRKRPVKRTAGVRARRDPSPLD